MTKYVCLFAAWVGGLPTRKSETAGDWLLPGTLGAVLMVGVIRLIA